MTVVTIDYLDSLSHDRSLGRIRSDVPTDLIYAPHISAIYTHLPDLIFERLKGDVKANRFVPGLPITIEIPKRNGLTRPGSILDPLTRTLYQLLVDEIAPFGESQIDRKRVYSQQLLDPDPDFLMFRSVSDCFGDFTQATDALAKKWTHVLKADISSFFERIYHHNLVNFLSSSGAPTEAVRALEKLLLSFTHKDSHGIIQGVFPSDFLGNVYLCPLDAELAVQDIDSTRYVDDLHLFFESQLAAKAFLVRLCQHLRREGLNLNEAKTQIEKTESLMQEDSVIREAFEKARLELLTVVSPIVEVTYGFSEWMEPDSVTKTDTSGLDLEATRNLFGKREDYPKYSDAIEKFCLPILAASGSDIAISDALNGITRRPYLSANYCSYLSTFVRNDPDLMKQLSALLLSPNLIYESQKMWILASLIGADSAEPSSIDAAIKLFTTKSATEAIRALACLFVGSHGSAAQRRILKQHYSNEESPYVRGAILYSSKYFPKNERDTCLTSWGVHSTTDSLIAQTVKKMVTI